LKAYSSKVVKTRQGTDVNLPATDYHKIKNYTFDTAVNTWLPMRQPEQSLPILPPSYKASTSAACTVLNCSLPNLTKIIQPRHQS